MADHDAEHPSCRPDTRPTFPQLSSEDRPPVIIVPDSVAAELTEARARNLLGSGSSLFEAGRRAGRAEAVAMLEAHEAALRAADR